MRNTNIDKPIYDGKTNKELLADRETYQLLLDDYIDGVDVREDEEITDYLKRKGFKGILDESSIKKKIKSVLMASETPEEEAELKKANELHEKLDQVIDDVIAELKSLGYSNFFGRYVSYEIFNQKNEFGFSTGNIVTEYSIEYDKQINYINKLFDVQFATARAIKNATNRKNAFNKAADKRQQWYRENTIQIDIRRIPEIINDSEFASFKQYFETDQTSIDNHVTELKSIMSKEEYDKFNKDLNEYYGTENERYEPYGRAGKGTVNLTFKEHWDNVGMQSPTMSKSPTLRFLAASGRNINEYLTSDYGTYKYAGPGTDSGGLLGNFGGTGGTQVSRQDREIMRNIAPEAPYIVSGIAKPSNSPAANWFNNLGNTSTSGGFDLATEYAAAKNAVSQTLNNRGPMGMLAVSDSPYYDWLKTKNLDRGIL